MRHVVFAAFLAVVLTAPDAFAGAPAITGDYVEARTAEVFAGGCIMNSEAETMGRQAVLAWRITSGTQDGVALDGLRVVAALSGDRNLGMREMGGEAPDAVKTAIIVDERATPAQRTALAAFAVRMLPDLPVRVVDVSPAPVTFERRGDVVEVAAGAATLSVGTVVVHDPNCGAMQWFHPLATVNEAAIGMTRSQAYWGAALGARWRQVDKKSAFWGTFSVPAVATRPATLQ
jgi:hypothetical protein